MDKSYKIIGSLQPLVSTEFLLTSLIRSPSGSLDATSVQRAMKIRKMIIFLSWSLHFTDDGDVLGDLDTPLDGDGLVDDVGVDGDLDDEGDGSDSALEGGGHGDLEVGDGGLQDGAGVAGDEVLAAVVELLADLGGGLGVGGHGSTGARGHEHYGEPGGLVGAEVERGLAWDEGQLGAGFAPVFFFLLLNEDVH